MLTLNRSVNLIPRIVTRSTSIVCFDRNFHQSKHKQNRHGHGGPFRFLEDFQPLDHTIDQLVNSWKNLSGEFKTPFGDQGENPGATHWKPRVDIKDTEESVSVLAELAGLTPEDVKVEINDDILTISGEKKFEKSDKQENYTLIERRYGKFTRKFPLSNNIDKNAIQAKFEHGLLEITLPKLKEQSNHIPIKIQWNGNTASNVEKA